MLPEMLLGIWNISKEVTDATQEFPVSPHGDLEEWPRAPSLALSTYQQLGYVQGCLTSQYIKRILENNLFFWELDLTAWTGTDCIDKFSVTLRHPAHMQMTKCWYFSLPVLSQSRKVRKQKSVHVRSTLPPWTKLLPEASSNAARPRRSHSQLELLLIPLCLTGKVFWTQIKGMNPAKLTPHKH